MPATLAMARRVQCVTPGSGAPQVSATTRATVPAGTGGLPGLRVLSRSNPSGPSSAKRCCQRQTIKPSGDWHLSRLPLVAPAGHSPRQERPARTLCACAAGCDPPRSPQVAFCPTCSIKRILSVPSTQICTSQPRCESAECVSALACSNWPARFSSDNLSSYGRWRGSATRTRWPHTPHQQQNGSV
jgi:hypothetical protein